jgi:hypothetical protein
MEDPRPRPPRLHLLSGDCLVCFKDHELNPNEKAKGDDAWSKRQCARGLVMSLLKDEPGEDGLGSDQLYEHLGCPDWHLTCVKHDLFSNRPTTCNWCAEKSDDQATRVKFPLQSLCKIGAHLSRAWYSNDISKNLMNFHAQLLVLRLGRDHNIYFKKSPFDAPTKTQEFGVIRFPPESYFEELTALQEADLPEWAKVWKPAHLSGDVLPRDARELAVQVRAS